ncbi:hypothetical protein ACFO5X_20345 [Seohaeicola nanhaiensis]|uniref:Uncharacterized protein n=1 Tax=Seohaeicola nanhaiensis TaxID=1387282 RepID=A0ABV9KLU6_9RHOB
MHFASFTSAAPLDHLGRVLDELRRRGFQLCGLAVSVGANGQAIAAANEGALAEIRIDFDASNAFAADNYLARIAGIPGIRDLQGGLAPRQA